MKAVKIPKKKLKWFERISLDGGAHGDIAAGCCALEAAAYLAGEPHSDSPACVSPAVAAFGREWNDRLPSNEERDRLLKPLVPEMLGTRTTDEDEVTRGRMAVDWLARAFVPAFLRLTPDLVEHAEALEKLEPILTDEQAEAAAALLSAAESAARGAALSAARGAAWSAARGAARGAAWSAAWSAARSAAESAAWRAAWSAAWRAAESAAIEFVTPTVNAMQASAQDLLRRMCAVGRQGEE